MKFSAYLTGLACAAVAVTATETPNLRVSKIADVADSEKIKKHAVAAALAQGSCPSGADYDTVGSCSACYQITENQVALPMTDEQKLQCNNDDKLEREGCKVTTFAGKEVCFPRSFSG